MRAWRRAGRSERRRGSRSRGAARPRRPGRRSMDGRDRRWIFDPRAVEWHLRGDDTSRSDEHDLTLLFGVEQCVSAMGIHVEVGELLVGKTDGPPELPTGEHCHAIVDGVQHVNGVRSVDDEAARPIRFRFLALVVAQRARARAPARVQHHPDVHRLLLPGRSEALRRFGAARRAGETTGGHQPTATRRDQVANKLGTLVVHDSHLPRWIAAAENGVAARELRASVRNAYAATTARPIHTPAFPSRGNDLLEHTRQRVSLSRFRQRRAAHGDSERDENVALDPRAPRRRCPCERPSGRERAVRRYQARPSFGDASAWRFTRP